MIRSYNRSQFIKATLCFLWGLFCCWLTYLFFHYTAVFLCSQFRHTAPAILPVAAGLAGLAVAGLSGHSRWQAGGGLFSYHESALYHELDEDTAGACVTSLYAHRVTGTAYLLGQVFLAGPLFILRARTLLSSRIPGSTDLEVRLRDTLARLRAADKWQGLGDHPGLKNEILYLARMGLIDFSAFKGTPRFKAR